jgi:hypothetical protein
MNEEERGKKSSYKMKEETQKDLSPFGIFKMEVSVIIINKYLYKSLFAALSLYKWLVPDSDFST